MSGWQERRWGRGGRGLGPAKGKGSGGAGGKGSGFRRGRRGSGGRQGPPNDPLFAGVVFLIQSEVLVTSETDPFFSSVTFLLQAEDQT